MVRRMVLIELALSFAAVVFPRVGLIHAPLTKHCCRNNSLRSLSAKRGVSDLIYLRR